MRGASTPEANRFGNDVYPDLQISVLAKLGVHDRAQAALYGVRTGMIDV